VNGLRGALIDLLPHGVVRRVAASRQRDRLNARIAERSGQLRAVRTTDDAPRLPRLNMGCGAHREPGWINADSDEKADTCLTLSEGEPLPFADGELEAVFSEHFLEHVPFRTGVHFLRESGRVLRSGGTFRVSCPDLDVIVGLLQPLNEQWKALARIYESIGDFEPGDLTLPEQVVNWAFYGHAHRHLWSFRQLETELSGSGFVDVRRMPFGVSRAEGVAIERRVPEDFYTLIVEGTRA